MVMSRPLRLQFSGALYHITSPGDGREPIYLNDRDRSEFLAILSQVCERYDWSCHSYCLMTNHYHLLMETHAATLARGMRQLNGVYTQRFNRAHGRDILPNCRGGFRPFNWLIGKFSNAVRVAEHSFAKFQASPTAEHYDLEAQREASGKRGKASLSAVFNEVSVARLFQNGKTLYLGAKTMPELIEKVGAFVPRNLRA